MNELEILMRAEAKKKAIEKDTTEKLQKVETEKARKWKKETLEKLSFLKDYGCEFDKYRETIDTIYVHPKEHGTIKIELSWDTDFTEVVSKRITKYDLDKPLIISWKYDMCGGDESRLSLEEFVKSLVRRGIVKMED